MAVLYAHVFTHRDLFRRMLPRPPEIRFPQMIKYLVILLLTGCVAKDIAYTASDGTRQKFIYRPGNDVLLVEFHTWSTNRTPEYTWNGLSLESESEKLGWAYIRPDARGENDKPDSCCGPLAIADINQNIEYALKRNRIKKIVLAGVSGGGYTALCYASRGLYKADLVSAWNPMTDLSAWLIEKKGTPYEPMIKGCGDLKDRSPINMPTDARIELYAGINDDTVPNSHSVKYYENASQCKPQDHAPISGAQVLKYCPGNVSLYIFEGGHDMIVPQVINSISQ